MSKGRRLIAASWTALAIACAVPLAWAEPDTKSAAPKGSAPPSKKPASKPKTGAAPSLEPASDGPPSLEEVPKKDEDKPADQPRPGDETTESAPTILDKDLATPEQPAPDEEQADLGDGKGEAKKDDKVERVQTSNPLPLAGASPKPTEPAPTPVPGLPYMIEPSRITAAGPQTVGLTAQVFSPPTMNLHKKGKVTIVVKNAGPHDAQGVVIHDQLPEGLKFLGSVPETAAPAGQLVSWSIGLLQANTEKRIVVEVEPEKTGTYDHVVAVAALTAAKSSTVVREPKLKVDLAVNKSRVLKGQQVQFDISVTNTGTGQARDVIVRAELSEGMAHVEGQGRVLELALADRGKASLAPGETFSLPFLVAGAEAGGKQECKVTATSPDVVEVASASNSVDVTEPKLKLTLEGSKNRPTDSVADYKITIANPGTAPAQDVKVTAILTGDGAPDAKAAGATWNPSQRRLTWTIPQLEPNGQPTTFPFRVRLGGVGTFQVGAEATARGRLRDFTSWSTQIVGTAELEVVVSERQRVIDMGQMTVFKIVIRNNGSKEAKAINVDAILSKNLVPYQTDGVDDRRAGHEPATNTVKFPLIDRLAPGAEITLKLQAEAKRPGTAKCRVEVRHEELTGEEAIEDVATLQVANPDPPAH